MKLSNLYLQAFFELSKTKNFTKSAKNIGITQSAFSHRIAKLEDELESTLIIRGRQQSLALTPEGQKLLRYLAIHSTLEAEFLDQFISDDESLKGRIRIAGFSSIVRSVLVPSLAETIRDNKHVKIQIYTKELNELEEALTSTQVDYIITNKVPKNKNTHSIFLGFEDNILIESTKYPKNHNYLDHDESDTVTSAYFNISKSKPKIMEKLYLGDVYGLIDGVKFGLGKAIVPRHLISDLKEIKIISPKTKLVVPVYLVYFSRPYETKLQKEVIMRITNYFHKIFRQV